MADFLEGGNGVSTYLHANAYQHVESGWTMSAHAEMASEKAFRLEAQMQSQTEHAGACRSHTGISR
jgi:hypothetical protein